MPSNNLNTICEISHLIFTNLRGRYCCCLDIFQIKFELVSFAMVTTPELVVFNNKEQGIFLQMLLQLYSMCFLLIKG